RFRFALDQRARSGHAMAMPRFRLALRLHSARRERTPLNRLRLRIVASFAVAILVIVTGWVAAAAGSSALWGRDRAVEAAQAEPVQALHDARMTRDLRLARAVVLVGSLLSFALAVLVNLSLMNALRERERSQQTVEKQAAQLREFTSSLIAHEKHLATQ